MSFLKRPGVVIALTLLLAGTPLMYAVSSWLVLRGTDPAQWGMLEEIGYSYALRVYGYVSVVVVVEIAFAVFVSSWTNWRISKIKDEEEKVDDPWHTPEKRP